MPNIDLSASAWDNRYKEQDIGWNLGVVSPPLKSYIDQLKNKDLKILIPGGGNSYEAEYLRKKGFKNVYVADISKTALDNIKKRVPDYPNSQLLQKNFFNISEQFDMILEQTFFCAIHPSLRNDYVKKVSELLNKNGKLVGVLFNAPLFTKRPPFGGNKEEYTKLFTPFFRLYIFEKCYNSIKSRENKELFIKFIKK